MYSAYRIGPAKSFKVFPGDVITGSVSAYFTSTSGYTAATATTMATALSSVLGGGIAAIDGGISSAYNTTGNPLIALGGFGGSTFPSGYLNYILFDENYVPIKAKSFPVQNLPSTRHTVQFDQSLEIKELGYLFVYLSYDNNNSNLYLYFDDLKITVEESPLIQVNNYYPFGMASATWLREGEQQNANLFQGKELIAQTGWHDFGSRMYWADLGRWFSTDPQKQFSSPYVGMGNMPAMGRDPDGEFWFVPMILGAVLNTAINADKIDNFWDAVGYAAVGGAAGALGAGIGTGLSAMIGGHASFGAGFAAAFAGQGTLAGAGIAGATSSFFSGAAIGGGAGFGAGFASGFGNGLIQGRSFSESINNGLADGAIGGLTGGLVGGVFGGIDAVKNDRRFFDGATVRKATVKDAGHPHVLQRGDGNCAPAAGESHSRGRFTQEQIRARVGGTPDTPVGDEFVWQEVGEMTGRGHERIPGGMDPIDIWTNMEIGNSVALNLQGDIGHTVLVNRITTKVITKVSGRTIEKFSLYVMDPALRGMQYRFLLNEKAAQAFNTFLIH